MARRSLGTAVSLIAIAAAGAAPGVASVPRAADRAAPVPVAYGLNNPRHLSVGSDGAVYVAESGVGGSGACIIGGEGKVCLGRTGSVTRIADGWQSRVITGLPSLAGTGGFSASGPSAVRVAGGRYTIAMGLGAVPALRDSLPPFAYRMGTVISGRLGSLGNSIADLAAYEGAKDYDGYGPDSNPVALTMAGSSYVVADAGANAVLRVTRYGKMAVVAVFPDRMVPKPPFLGPGMMPMQSVPTGVSMGPDGAYYVSELTGFPFPAGGARIYRVKAGQQPTVYASGLTNVTDLAWANGKLYAVQLSDAGLLNVPEGELPVGSLVEARPGGNRVVAAGLLAPYGVAVKGTNAYVTTCGMCAGIGGVSRISLSGS